MPSTFYAGQPDYIEKLNSLAAGAASALTGTTLAANVVNASLNSITPSGGTLAVTGSISATNSTGRIDANDSRAAGVGVGGSLFLRGKDDNGDYQDFAGINAFLTDGTVGNVGADLIFKTRLSGTLAERMRLLSSGDLLINQTTNPSSYKLAVTGNVGVTGAISATAGMTATGGSSFDLNNASNNSAISITNLGGSGASFLRIASGSTWLEYNPAIGLSVTGSISAVTAAAAAHILRQNTSTSYTTFRLYNDLNSGSRALEIDYAGSAYAGALLTGGPSGESAAIYTTGNYPLTLGVSGSAIVNCTLAGATVTGLTTTDTLRVNVTPTAETPTATHTAVFNISGTNYKFLCLVA